MDDDHNFVMSMALSHWQAAGAGKEQYVDGDIAEHMGAFHEDALDWEDARDSIFYGEIDRG